MAGLSLRKKTDLTKPDHSAVREADPFAFQASHRRQGRLLGISAGINMGLAFAVIAQALTIHGLAPLKTVEVALVRADPADDRIYRIEPIGREVDGFDLLMEASVRRYVKLMLEVDAVSQKDRWLEAEAMTDPSFVEKFSRERTPAVEEAVKRGLNRSIVVESAQRLSERDGVFAYAVDFVQIDERAGGEAGRKPLRAYLSVTTRPQEAREKDRFENPLGFTVLDLVLKEKSAPAPAEEASLR